MAFLLYVILAILILSILFMTIKVQLIIEKFEYKRKSQKNILNNKKETSKQTSFLIKLRICLFYKIPIVAIKIDDEKLKRLERKKSFEKMEKKLKKSLSKMQEDFINKFNKNKNAKAIMNIITVAKEFKMQFKNINLKINIGLENVIATSILVPIIATVISFILHDMEIKKEKNEYKITPIYNLQNLGSKINISLKCIIEVKMIHIINVIYIMKNQRKVSDHVRTSNRRSYDYSYE